MVSDCHTTSAVLQASLHVCQLAVACPPSPGYAHYTHVTFTTASNIAHQRLGQSLLPSKIYYDEICAPLPPFVHARVFVTGLLNGASVQYYQSQVTFTKAAIDVGTTLGCAFLPTSPSTVPALPGLSWFGQCQKVYDANGVWTSVGVFMHVGCEWVAGPISPFVYCSTLVASLASCRLPSCPAASCCICGPAPPAGLSGCVRTLAKVLVLI